MIAFRGVNVYVTPDGRTWVTKEAYDSLRGKAALTEDECRALGAVHGIMRGLLKIGKLSGEERQRVEGVLETVEEMVYRLAGGLD